ncbi:MAG: hypothetical protein M3Y50_04905 [Acidobacteriota bacterium]|nr:hypothetical protein [Acidobacteriota bacterium]
MIRISNITRRVAGAALCLGFSILVGGCRHRVVLAPLPPVLTPVDPVEVPQPENPPLLEAPVVRLPAVPIAAAAARLPKPSRRRTRGGAVAPAAGAGSNSGSASASGSTPASGTGSAPASTPGSGPGSSPGTGPESKAAAPVAAPSAEASAIGALTAGGEANPQTKQEASDLLASIEKRLNALPAQMNDDGRAQVNKVRNFWREAQAALQSGDAEGAKTLATKAKLLLDDLEK